MKIKHEEDLNLEFYALFDGLRDKLKLCMHENNISQSKLSAEAGITQPYISMTLSGKQRSLSTVIKMLLAIGYKVELVKVGL